MAKSQREIMKQEIQTTEDPLNIIVRLHEEITLLLSLNKLAVKEMAFFAHLHRHYSKEELIAFIVFELDEKVRDIFVAMQKE